MIALSRLRLRGSPFVIVACPDSGIQVQRVLATVVSAPNDAISSIKDCMHV